MRDFGFGNMCREAASEFSIWDEVSVNFISLADLRKNKASTGPRKDAADLRNLNKVKQK